MKTIIFAALILALVTLGCSVVTGPDCSEFAKQLEGIAERWDDASELASTTGRIALSGPIADLQSIRRDTNAMEIPDCATAAHEQLVNHMDATIDAYLAFAGDDEGEAALQIELASTYLNNFDRELEKLISN